MRHSVATKIREKLEEQHISVQAFERKAGLKLNAVQNILSGRSTRPGIDVLIAVSKAFGCTVNDLLGQITEPSQQKNEEHVRFTNIDLLRQTMVFLAAELKQENFTVTSKILQQLIQEIYSYSEENNQGGVDEGFAKWLIAKQNSLFSI